MRVATYILILLIFGCKPSIQEKVYSSSNYLIDSIDITVFTTDSMKNRVFTDDYKVVQLNKSDIFESENLLKDYINQYNIKGTKRLDSLKRYFQEVKHKNVQLYEDPFRIDLRKYGRQYIAVKNKENHIIVYLNCFCNPSEFDYRKKDWVFVFDGGNCFFQMKIDLTDKKVIEFSENGVA